MLRSLRCDKTEEIRVALNKALDVCIPNAILDCIRDLDNDLKAKAVSDISCESGNIRASCSVDLVREYPELANLTNIGFYLMLQSHGGIKTLEASLRDYFTGCDIQLTTTHKTILVYAICKV